MYPTSDIDIKIITEYVTSQSIPVTKMQVFEHIQTLSRKSKVGSEQEQWAMFSRNFDALLDNGTLRVSCNDSQ
jgi:hypothetical protein